MENDFGNLVKLSIHGDKNAFSKLYTSVYKDLYHIALCNLNNPQDAADCVSDAVIDAFSSISKLKNESAFRSWIIAILFKKIKKKQAEYIKQRNKSTEISSVEHSIDFNYKNIELYEEISKLEDDEKAVLSMSVIGGYTSEEIQKFTGIKANTVRSKLARTKEKLKAKLFSA